MESGSGNFGTARRSILAPRSPGSEERVEAAAGERGGSKMDRKLLFVLARRFGYSLQESEECCLLMGGQFHGSPSSKENPEEEKKLAEESSGHRHSGSLGGGGRGWGFFRELRANYPQ